MKYSKSLILLIGLMAPLMGAECSSPDGSYHETATFKALDTDEHVNVNPVPEPSSAILFALGLVLGAAFIRSRK